MGKRSLWLAIFLVFSFVFSTAAFAEVNFKFGGSERIRHEYWKNNTDMDSQRDDTGDLNFFRFRTSLWGQVDLGEMFDVYLRLTNEFKPFTYRGGNPGKNYHFDIHEAIIDNLYVDVKKPFEIPLSFRLGRQDLVGIYGESFLIADGTPGDGSRTMYFNAFKTSWEISAERGQESSLDFIYVRNPRDDIYFPVINEDKAPQSLNTTPEEGYILYFKSKPIENLAFEPYYIYKREGYVGGTGMQAQKGRINTMGAFVKYTLGSWVFRTQLADQFGKYGLQDRQALGGYLFVDKDFKDAFWKPSLTLGSVYLSGDDKGSNKNEGWDPLFSRYPWFSDLIGNNFKGETGISCYWTNLQMYRTGVMVKPMEKMKLSFFYNYLRANELTAPSTTYSLSGGSKDRGHLVQGKIEYNFTKNISTFFLAEFFDSGHFYSSTADDAIFLRSEVTVKF